MRIFRALGLIALGAVFCFVIIALTRFDPVGPPAFQTYMGGGDQGFTALYWPPFSDLDEFAIRYSAAMRCETLNMSVLETEISPPREGSFAALWPRWITITCSA